MTRSAPILALVLMLSALAGCGDSDRDRGGLGPRGTALPPPQPGAEPPR